MEYSVSNNGTCSLSKRIKKGLGESYIDFSVIEESVKVWSEVYNQVKFEMAVLLAPFQPSHFLFSPGETLPSHIPSSFLKYPRLHATKQMK